MAPLFEVRMELDEVGLVFHPSLEMGTDNSLLMLIESLVNDIYNAAKLIPRPAKGQMSYKVSLGPQVPGSGLPRPTVCLTLGCAVTHSSNAQGCECGKQPGGVSRVPRGTSCFPPPSENPAVLPGVASPRSAGLHPRCSRGVPPPPCPGVSLASASPAPWAPPHAGIWVPATH